jgi:hypothetical protein
MSTAIDLNGFVSLQEAAQLIATNPRVRFMLRGEKGIGKSSILSMILKLLNGTHEGVYRDVATMAEGEAGIPMPNHESRTTSIYPNAGFQLHTDKPVVLCLDEFSKGSPYIQNMLHPLLERTRPRFGDIYLPNNSIIFLTGNLSEEGLGDTLKGHTLDRIVELRVRKPTAAEWLEWAVNNGVDPIVCAWVRATPHCLASFMDAGQQGNHYIYHPRRVQGAVVTPRSLDIASDIVSTRHLNSSTAVTAALVGKIGSAATHDLQAYIDYQDQIPQFKEIVEDPQGARLPTSPGACSILVYGAVQKVTRETMTPFMSYVARLGEEWQAVFVIAMAKNPEKQNTAFTCKAFAEWFQKNEDLL